MTKSCVPSLASRWWPTAAALLLVGVTVLVVHQVYLRAAEPGETAAEANEFDPSAELPPGPPERRPPGGPQWDRPRRPRGLEDRPMPDRPRGPEGMWDDDGPPPRQAGPVDQRDGRRPRRPQGPEDRPLRPGPPPDREDICDQFGPRPLSAGLGPRMPRGPQGDQGMLERLNPEMAKAVREDMDLQQRARDLVRQYREAASAERDAIKQQLDQLVKKHFDARQQRRSLELKHLESEVQRLREAIERRNKARDQIIQARMSELLGEDGLSF